MKFTKMATQKQKQLPDFDIDLADPKLQVLKKVIQQKVALRVVNMMKPTNIQNKKPTEH